MAHGHPAGSAGCPLRLTYRWPMAYDVTKTDDEFYRTYVVGHKGWF